MIERLNDWQRSNERSGLGFKYDFDILDLPPFPACLCYGARYVPVFSRINTGPFQFSYLLIPTPYLSFLEASS